MEAQQLRNRILKRLPALKAYFFASIVFVKASIVFVKASIPCGFDCLSLVLRIPAVS